MRVRMRCGQGLAGCGRTVQSTGANLRQTGCGLTGASLFQISDFSSTDFFRLFPTLSDFSDFVALAIGMIAAQIGVTDGTPDRCRLRPNRHPRRRAATARHNGHHPHSPIAEGPGSLRAPSTRGAAWRPIRNTEWPHPFRDGPSQGPALPRLRRGSRGVERRVGTGSRGEVCARRLGGGGVGRICREATPAFLTGARMDVWRTGAVAGG